MQDRYKDCRERRGQIGKWQKSADGVPSLRSHGAPGEIDAPIRKQAKSELVKANPTGKPPANVRECSLMFAYVRLCSDMFAFWRKKCLQRAGNFEPDRLPACATGQCSSRLATTPRPWNTVGLKVTRFVS